ncbi:phosphotransferase enzyme family protein [Streptosporangium sp. NBC_01756]|uniref:phosphotransferase enzyme family protein n=1 Tax=Streptosporangium sp. NBC_01756 TaxID=2975950 RepID=UPI002DDB8B43|nr:phosphotransferase [Streptosporangium sp. NBC_01756]WSC89649.1 phosphotransferase [Streptosporangium sp. NBC_01756]
MAGSSPSVCGPLDVGDKRGFVSTGPVPRAEVARACAAALRSPAFDGPAGPCDPEATVVYGHRTVVKVQHRLHERFETALRMESMRERAGVRVPALLDAGTVETASGPRWWLVLERIDGSHGEHPTPAQQRQVGEQLRRWHDAGERGGLRLDDPGALGVMLGSARTLVPHVYPGISRLLDEACAGRPVTAIHGDVAVGHNTLFDGDELQALFDPGAVEVGPPMLDLAWCLAVDLPRGTQPRWLLEGYGTGAVDQDALDALLPLMVLRRMIDVRAEGPSGDARWLADWLAGNAPALLPLTEPAVRS